VRPRSSPHHLQLAEAQMPAWRDASRPWARKCPRPQAKTRSVLPPAVPRHDAAGSGGGSGLGQDAPGALDRPQLVLATWLYGVVSNFLWPNTLGSPDVHLLSRRWSQAMPQRVRQTRLLMPAASWRRERPGSAGGCSAPYRVAAWKIQPPPLTLRSRRPATRRAGSPAGIRQHRVAVPCALPCSIRITSGCCRWSET